jgi:hypothetical protein
MTKKAAQKEPADALFTVLLPNGARPGIRAVGAMKPGVEYRVSLAEATRLVGSKGFQFATDTEAVRHRAAVDQFNAAGLPGTDSPANSDGQGGGTHDTTAQE